MKKSNIRQGGGKKIIPLKLKPGFWRNCVVVISA